MHGEIAGRRADDPACSRKGTRDQRGVGQMADIDGHIHPALQRIAGLHPQMHLDAERWMLLAEGGDQRRQLRRGKSRRRADAKRVAMQVVWRDRRIRLLHRVDGAQRGGMEFLAFGRQRHAAAGTAEQPDAKAILQPRHQLADRGRCQREAARRGREITFGDGAGKDQKLTVAIHRCMPPVHRSYECSPVDRRWASEICMLQRRRGPTGRDHRSTGG